MFYSNAMPLVTSAHSACSRRKRWIDQGYVIWNAKATDLAERMRREHVLWAEVTKGMAFE